MNLKTFEDTSPTYGQDPFIVQTHCDLLLIESQDEERITISTLEDLQSTRRLATITVWDNPSERQVWAPELHNVVGSWIIFYTASDGRNKTHRPYFLKSTTDSPFGPFKYGGRVGPDVWGIDMSYFQLGNNHYVVWSGWERENDEFPQNLYIANLETPTRRVLLSTPEFSWENQINEGPQWHNSSEFGIGLTFSVNASWTQDYSTAFLELVGSNPLNPEHWAKDSKPLARNVGHGHQLGEFFVYHKKLSPFPGWQDRVIEVSHLSDLKNGPA